MTGRATATSDGPDRPTERLAEPVGGQSERARPPTLQLATRPLGVLQVDQEGRPASGSPQTAETPAEPGPAAAQVPGPTTTSSPTAADGTATATEDTATAADDRHSGRNGERLRVVPPTEPIATKLCPELHPNDPDSPACRICHQPFAAAEQVMAMAPTSVARLLLEDGTAVDVSDGLTIGRCPTDGGAGDTLTVTGRQVSRHHLSVEARGWELFVRDCDSTNGTFLTRRGEKGRRRVPTDRAIPVRIGDSIHFGSRQALVVQARSG